MQALSLPQMLSYKGGFASRVIGRSAARHLKRASSAALLSEGSAFLNHALKVIVFQFVWKTSSLLWSTVCCPHGKCVICNPGFFVQSPLYLWQKVQEEGQSPECRLKVTGGEWDLDLLHLVTGEYLFPHFPKLGWAVVWCLFITPYPITNIWSSVCSLMQISNLWYAQLACCFSPHWQKGKWFLPEPHSGGEAMEHN